MEATARVFHVVQVSGGMEGTEFDSRIPCQDLGDDGWDDGAGGLAGPVSVEGSRGDHGEAEGEVEGFGYFVGGDFRC